MNARRKQGDAKEVSTAIVRGNESEWEHDMRRRAMVQHVVLVLRRRSEHRWGITKIKKRQGKEKVTEKKKMHTACMAERGK
jgi:hypothetical protein